jgi:hypothetical protein
MNYTFLTLPPPLGPTSATFEPGANFKSIPCNIDHIGKMITEMQHVHISFAENSYAVDISSNDYILYPVMRTAALLQVAGQIM